MIGLMARGVVLYVIFDRLRAASSSIPATIARQKIIVL
jgi:hypothetical protein